MKLDFLHDRTRVGLQFPDETLVYQSRFPRPASDGPGVVETALDQPVGAPVIEEALRHRRPGRVVVVVSDITRPVPYRQILPLLFRRLEAAGVRRSEIVILVATGMHRENTPAEHAEMFGAEVTADYLIIDHRAEDEVMLVEVPGRTRSGNRIRLNRHLVDAGFRVVTGLVEPHFMAGFSGGRKAVCPGCADLGTVRNFHGEAFMAHPHSCNGRLDGNPLHDEALSVVRALGIDYSLNVVLNDRREIVRGFAGAIEAAHEAACTFAAVCACPAVEREADLVVTSSGGYPLDATFYQCVKSFVSCLPAVRRGGRILSFGGCSEGIGSPEYTETMFRFAGGRWRDFLEHIRQPGNFTKDQWQFQMHCRTLERIGEEHLLFLTDGLAPEVTARLSVTPAVRDGAGLQAALQAAIDEAAATGLKIAALPEGPYCAPIAP